MKLLTRVFIILLLAICLMYFKTQVVSYEKKIAILHQEIIEAHNEINILSAEYAYLTRPERIQELATNKLRMQFPKHSKITTINSAIGGTL